MILLDSFAEARRGDRTTLDPALRAAGTLAARYLQQKEDTALARKVLRGEIPEGSEVVKPIRAWSLAWRFPRNQGRVAWFCYLAQDMR